MTAAKQGASYGSALIIFLFHLFVTVVLGYVLLPRFESLVEPPPQPPSFAPIVRAAVYLFYFPIVSLAHEASLIGLSRPGLLFILGNSLLVTAVLLGIRRLFRSTRRLA